MPRTIRPRGTITQIFGIAPPDGPAASEPAPRAIACELRALWAVEACRADERAADEAAPSSATDPCVDEAEAPRSSSYGDFLPVEGELVGGLYRLVRLIGEGMFGRVYIAERTDVPEHKVALKVMSRAVYAGRNVERELVMLAAASHPHIVQLKDHGMTEHYVWLTMPLYRGETLAERLARGPLGLREAYEIFLPISRGVEALHVAGLRHQDVKPENIYLARFAGRLHPVLLDLGVAVEHNATFVAGTVMYAAPEQVIALGGLGEGVALGAKIDTYGLGCTLLRSLVGPEHFPGECAETPFAVASAFVERESKPLRPEALPLLTGAPRTLLAEAFRRWLAYDPSARPTTGEFAEQLDVLLEQEREVDAEIERSRVRQKATLQRLRVAAGAMLLVGISAAGFGYSKRETLRLAAELERSRAEGAESFDKLDTCVAAHQISQREAYQCSRRAERDRLDFKAAIDDLGEEGSRAQTLLANRIANYTFRLRTCEDDARKASDTWSSEKTELQRDWRAQLAGWEQERATLARERDDRAAEARSCQQNVGELGSTRDECRQDLASCIEDRDTCLHAVESRPARNEVVNASATSAPPESGKERDAERGSSGPKAASTATAPSPKLPSPPAAAVPVPASTPPT